MEKLVNPYDKESMKMAMLKHEETFRYQKGLMKNIAEQKRQQESQGAKKAAITTNSNDKQDSSKGTAEECIGESGDLGIEDESELELTLGPSCYNRRRKAAEAASDSALSFSSSSSDSSHVRRSSSGKAESNLVGEIKSRSNNAPAAEQFRQDKMKSHPPWLFQFLSLNMT
ncbi:uncharacterized protein LOC116013592 isoform X2 [Ipomoea triloba]|uniref:uncharacterized protein LOC116013592 isoform X2 n=1 Tax=Ipomoea triloba TaxID=35885 RepID=UPI00125E494B|nr:uncharacterized protein LOC116013592 isoform X2 [Ipomoea triloba]